MWLGTSFLLPQRRQPGCCLADKRTGAAHREPQLPTGRGGLLRRAQQEVPRRRTKQRIQPLGELIPSKRGLSQSAGKVERLHLGGLHPGSGSLSLVWIAGNAIKCDACGLERPIEWTSTSDIEDLPEATKRVYDRLGIPEAERTYLSGVTAQASAGELGWKVVGGSHYCADCT
jgi:hypothetical protein